mmetsp:Transcript_101671/g.206595  ORF Transcript_101671/g.206595 Transcript_101671/m.206595 type:complete len:127 (-) Transcript_101671:1655-2035(-)
MPAGIHLGPLMHLLRRGLNKGQRQGEVEDDRGEEHHTDIEAQAPILETSRREVNRVAAVKDAREKVENPTVGQDPDGQVDKKACDQLAHAGLEPMNVHSAMCEYVVPPYARAPPDLCMNPLDEALP